MHGDSLPTRHPLGGDGDAPLPQHELARLLYAQRQQRNALSNSATSGRRREQQAARLAQLGRDLEALAREIETLTQSRDLLVARQLHRFDDLDGSSVKAVVEYFRVFQRGLILSPVDAIAFLRQVAAEDIQLNGFTGRSVLTEQWKTYSMCWDNLEFRLLETKVIPLSDEEATVVTSATFAAHFSRLTLAMVFPHVLQSRRMVRGLLRQKIVARAHLGFVYNRTKKQFVRLTITMGFVDALAKLLPDPVDMATLFSRALLTDEFYIGETSSLVTMVAEGADQQHAERGRVAPPDLEEAKPDVSVPQRADKMSLDHVL